MRNVRLLRTVCCATIIALINQVCVPLVAFALTSGPTQPEFGKFEPVTTTSMVNEFTGDFTYALPVLNIPGPDGGGYALSLSYHSGESGEEESSWVGKGWTLNAGAINRIRRGFPDDYNGQSIKHHNKVETNWTVSVGRRLGLEGFSKEAGVEYNVNATYNNYRGYANTEGFGIDVMGIVDLGYSVTNGNGSWSVAVNPAAILHKLYAAATNPESVKQNDDDRLGADIDKIQSDNNYRATQPLEQAMGGLNSAARYVVNMFADNVHPTYFSKYTGMSYVYHVAMETDAGAPIGPELGYNASYTYQENEDEEIGAYGYMYSANGFSHGSMDYYVEKEAGFNKRDNYLGIPFSNADQFIVSGEGVGGGFRAYNRRVGQFRPEGKQSETGVVQLGTDVHVGGAIGVGATLSASSHTLFMGGWTPDGAGYRFASGESGDDSVFFRFAGDMGGSVSYSNDSLLRADASQYAVPPSISKVMNGGKRSGRSSYIGYSTNGQMREQPQVECYGAAGPSYLKSYNKSDASRRYVDRTDGAIQSGVGEFAVVTPNGMRYVYGLPVYSRNEKELSYVINGAVSRDGYLVYKSRTVTDGGYMVGEERNAPYATTFLLTEITTSDYVDRTNDGPSPDDLGGYTLFKYGRTGGSNNKSTGSADDWYKWRIPYRGLEYHRNSLSDGRDDMGSVSYGEKEIYYLDTIETKTHIALFRTSPRDDGFEAVHDESVASNDSTATTASGTNRLQKLDRIDLYAKDSNGAAGKLLTTAHFEYDYSLCPNLPNAKVVAGSSPVQRMGHLTLKRLYFEHEGTVSARTSPYFFGYEYRRSTAYNGLTSTLKTKYDDVVTYCDRPSLVENPAYSPFALDPWGNYRYDGASRALNWRPWVDQQDAPEFDPAAYQLKWIKLPSGGEIHVQYEQKDYRYVQNRPVMAMCGLRSTAPDDNLGGTPLVHMNLATLGITDGAEIARLRDTINGMIKRDERFYFKFLYALEGSTANLTNCASEFITGYVKLDTAMIAPGDSTDLQLRLLPSGKSINDDDEYEHPQDVAWNFVATSRAGIVDKYGSCDPRVEAIHHDEQGAWDAVASLIGTFGNEYFHPDVQCRRINLEHSYLRIPLNRAKKGGGVRVKRLLMYDPGYEASSAKDAGALYGTEYIYKREDGTSSGVATNEPSIVRFENPLVTYLKKRDDQSWINKALSGEDREQFEGPFGESILPAPSIGHSRVLVRNIHTGKTAPGYSVKEYNTAYDFPFDMQYTADGYNLPAAAATDMGSDDDPLILTNGIVVMRNFQLYRTQGYRFIQNGMHGTVKREAAYGGDAADGTNDDPLIAETTNEYFAPGESVPMIHEFGKAAVMEYPGKESEVVMEERVVDDNTFMGGVSVDLTVVFSFIPYLVFSGFPPIDVNEETLHTHVITKVIRYPAILKSTRTFRDGVEHLSENVGFDPATGRPVLVKTEDGYDKLVLGSSSTPHAGAQYSATIPAWSQYPAFGQLAERERLTITAGSELTIEKRYDVDHTLSFVFKAPGIASRSLAQLTPGDLVRITDAGTPARYLGTFYVGAVALNQVALLPTYISNANTEARVSVGTVEVLRSARTNQLSIDAGSVATYGTSPAVVNHPLP